MLPIALVVFHFIMLSTLTTTPPPTLTPAFENSYVCFSGNDTEPLPYQDFRLTVQESTETMCNETTIPEWICKFGLPQYLNETINSTLKHEIIFNPMHTNGWLQGQFSSCMGNGSACYDNNAAHQYIFTATDDEVIELRFSYVDIESDGANCTNDGLAIIVDGVYIDRYCDLDSKPDYRDYIN